MNTTDDHGLGPIYPEIDALDHDTAMLLRQVLGELLSRGVDSALAPREHPPDRFGWIGPMVSADDVARDLLAHPAGARKSRRKRSNMWADRAGLSSPSARGA